MKMANSHTVSSTHFTGIKSLATEIVDSWMTKVRGTGSTSSGG